MFAVDHIDEVALQGAARRAKRERHVTTARRTGSDGKAVLGGGAAAESMHFDPPPKFKGQGIAYAAPSIDSALL